MSSTIKFTPQFTGIPIDQVINEYSWDFGDGNTSTSADPTHTYSNPGDYIVSLTVNNITKKKMLTVT